MQSCKNTPRKWHTHAKKVVFDSCSSKWLRHLSSHLLTCKGTHSIEMIDIETNIKRQLLISFTTCNGVLNRALEQVFCSSRVCIYLPRTDHWASGRSTLAERVPMQGTARMALGRRRQCWKEQRKPVERKWKLNKKHPHLGNGLLNTPYRAEKVKLEEHQKEALRFVHGK